MGTLGKRVRREPPWVQIPYPPRLYKPYHYHYHIRQRRSASAHRQPRLNPPSSTLVYAVFWTGFVTSGIADEEHRRLQGQDRRFVEFMGSLVEPLRIANLTDYTRSLGLPDVVPAEPVTSVLMSPILHGEASVGAIYLARLAPSAEFSPGDEEVLSMFASQAALVISNARRYRDARRARAGDGRVQCWGAAAPWAASRPGPFAAPTRS